MSRPYLAWVDLHLPVPVAPEAAESAIRALAGLSGSPLVVLEAIGYGGAVEWRLGTPPARLERVLAAIRPHLGELRVEAPRRAASPEVAIAARLHIRGHRQASLDIGQREPVARGVLAALSAARVKETVRLQVVLGPRYLPRRAPRPATLPDSRATAERRDLTLKLGQARFGCTVRIAASASEPRAGVLVSGVISALRGLAAPGAAVSTRRSLRWAVTTAEPPFLWPLHLTVSEVTAVLGWPLATKDTALPGVPARHPRLLPVGPAVRSQGRLLGMSALASARSIALGRSDSLRHVHILGPNGVGKSTLMANLALQDIHAGHGVVVIDPKGDLVRDLLARLPAERLDDVVVLDPSDAEPVGIDAFAGHPDLAADVVLGVFHSLYESAWGPRTSDILHASLLSLAVALTSTPRTTPRARR